MRKTHLVIPDVHAHPEFDNDRLVWLGRMIMDLRPDVIVCLGDFADLPSLSSYDKGTRKFEGRRYVKDIKCTIDANEKLWKEVKEYNKKKVQQKKKKYSPKRVMVLGNHEYRIERAVDLSTELEGVISYDNLKYKQYWKTIIPFKQTIVIDGIAYSHYFSSGVMGKPIGGVNISNSIISKGHMTATQGHNHVLSLSEQTTFTGQRHFGLTAGCYVHPDYVEDWCKNTRHMWWEGVVVKHLYASGEYDIELYSAKRIKEKYA